MRDQQYGSTTVAEFANAPEALLHEHGIAGCQRFIDDQDFRIGCRRD